MKRFRLLVVALLLGTVASAQRYGEQPRGEGYSPTVYLISVHEVDTLYNYGLTHGEVAARNRMAIQNATEDYLRTYRPGFQQAQQPQFIFASKNNRFSLAIGGTLEMRIGYGFKGLTMNRDMVPADIPMPGNYNSRQQLNFDASNSRIFVKSITNTERLGQIVVFIDADFRGGREDSYTPRVRSAYLSLSGFTLGRDVTTFCDLEAAPTTIDYRGPNAYNFNFATLVRYELNFADNRMKFGIAAEQPNARGTYNDHYAELRQRVPDFPAYLQFSWGLNRDSHIRLSTVLRTLYMHNTTTGSNTSLLGWGAQVSGTIKVSRPLRLFMSGVYGEGITPYLQDLIGTGLDFTPNPADTKHIQTMPMWGWQAAAQINLTRRFSLSGGFSMVRVERKHGQISDTQYRQGNYIFGNLFCTLTPRCKVAVEYLYGKRYSMDKKDSHANRGNLMFQYNF